MFSLLNRVYCRCWFSVIIWTHSLLLSTEVKQRFCALGVCMWVPTKFMGDIQALFFLASACLRRQEYFSRFQDKTDALPCHIHLLVCLCIMDPHSRATKKNASHENEVLPQDTAHLIQRPCYQWASLCQDPAGNQTIWKPPYHKEMWSIVMSPIHLVWPKLSRKAQRKGEEDKTDRRSGGKTTSGNGQAWSSPSPRG